jgi:dipeptidyl aminopeptidase/acylaminoacyl peptidase
METIEYAPGRLADLYGARGNRTVLLWHGMQTDGRDGVRPLAELVAGHGLSVVAPDWNSHAADGGRTDLLQSAQAAMDRSDGDIVIVGWSLGGLAAAGLTINTSHSEVRVAHTVCLAGAFTATDPLSGKRLPTELPSGEDRPPFTLLHGVDDDVVPIEISRTFAATLERCGWPVELAELDADHGSIAGAVYDSARDRYRAAEDSETLAIAADIARRIAEASGSGSNS